MNKSKSISVFKWVGIILAIFGLNFYLTLCLQSAITEFNKKGIYNLDDDTNAMLIEAEIKKELKENRLNNIYNVILFLYTNNYTERVLYTSADIVSLKSLNVTSDPVLNAALKKHQHNICFSSKIENLDPTSNLTTQLKTNIAAEDIASSFYVSCPVFVDDNLLGFVAAIINRSENGFVTDLNRVLLIARIVSRTFSTNIE